MKLVPYKEIDPVDLAADLHRLVSDPYNQRLLGQRMLNGLIARHAEKPNVDAVKRSQDMDPTKGASYAIVYEHDEVVGAGTILNDHPLTMWPTGKKLVVGEVNVGAWLGAGFEDDLDSYKFAYTSICAAALSAVDTDDPSKFPRLWTVEPVRSPSAVHSGIALSGNFRYTLGNVRRYDDYEHRRLSIVPRGVLYKSS